MEGDSTKRSKRRGRVYWKGTVQKGRNGAVESIGRGQYKKIETARLESIGRGQYKKCVQPQIDFKCTSVNGGRTYRMFGEVLDFQVIKYEVITKFFRETISIRNAFVHKTK